MKNWIQLLSSKVDGKNGWIRNLGERKKIKQVFGCKDCIFEKWGYNKEQEKFLPT